MKITRLEIADYQQFKDFAIDLTYPAGHPKAGEPLDKICLIGQSGTGKTTILNMINDFWKKNYEEKRNKIAQINKISQIYFIISDGNVAFSNFCYKKDDTIIFRRDGKSEEPQKINRIIYFQTGLENHTSALLGELEDNYPLVRTKKDEFELIAKRRAARLSYMATPTIESQKHFSEQSFRISLLQRLDDFDKMLIEKISEVLISKNSLQKDVQGFLAQNPRIDISKKLQPILERFHIELVIDPIKGKGGLKLQTLGGKDFELPFASTGTKQILLSALPLILMETAHKVILFDEPERSLYPDIQRVIIKHYTELAPDAQFFFATHSPLIASQFEPWEIVELKFNEEGKVYRELYYKGENHVDNYTIFPQYLSWGDILTSVFHLDYDGNRDFRIDLLPKAQRLKVQLDKMEKEGKSASNGKDATPEYKAKMADFIKYANLLGWPKELRTFYEENR